jgi:tRNA(Ile)-lysidine synthase
VPVAPGDKQPDAAPPLTAGEAASLLACLPDKGPVLLAVSGGPDSLALLALASAEPALAGRVMAASVDHGLRAEGAAEARAVGALCARLGVPHKVLVWRGAKPATGLQDAAREARFRLLALLARETGAALVTAHHADDQAETVLARIAAGTGLTGLGAMAPSSIREGVAVLRPFLTVPKARLVATCAALGLTPVADPSNADPRFQRARLRAVQAALAGEGLTVERLTQLAARARRADAALEAACDGLATACRVEHAGAIALKAARLAAAPAELRLRLLARCLREAGAGRVELARLEALEARLAVALAADQPFAATLAGIKVWRMGTLLIISPAPPRRGVNPATSGRRKPA